MTKYLFTALAVAAMGLSTTACTSACDDAQDRIDQKIRDCGLTVPKSTATTADSTTCTDSEAQAQSKSADAFVAEPCEQVKKDLGQPE